MTAVLEPPTNTAPTGLTFLELEITGRCQLTCSSHCYAEAGPTRGHGSMTGEDWRRVIDEAGAMGVATVQFIGGEPTLHPEFTALVKHALDAGLRTADELLDEAWSDAPAILRPAAAVTLAAHLDKLAEEGRLPEGVERPRFDWPSSQG